MAVGFNSRPKEWSRPPEPHPAEADCGSSGDKRRPYVSLIWCSTTSGHGNGLRPWIRNNNRRTAHELLNLTLDLDHAHVSGRSSCFLDDLVGSASAARPEASYLRNRLFCGLSRHGTAPAAQKAPWAGWVLW